MFLRICLTIKKLFFKTTHRGSTFQDVSYGFSRATVSACFHVGETCTFHQTLFKLEQSKTEEMSEYVLIRKVLLKSGTLSLKRSGIQAQGEKRQP